MSQIYAIDFKQSGNYQYFARPWGKWCLFKANGKLVGISKEKFKGARVVEF
jgi:hypothetical protein